VTRTFNKKCEQNQIYFLFALSLILMLILKSGDNKKPLKPNQN